MGAGAPGEERLFQFFFSFSFILFQALITGNENSVFIIYLIFKSRKKKMNCALVVYLFCRLCVGYVMTEYLFM